MNQHERVKNTGNPLGYGDKDELVRRIVDLMPKSDENQSTEEEQGLFDAARKRRQEAYQKARYGSLPEHTYRILEQGSFIGWYYELELEGNTIPLKDDNGNEFLLYGNGEKAIEIAKTFIAEKFGKEAADKATFRFMFGGQL